MTPIERQILENQKAIIHHLSEQIESRESLIKMRMSDCIIKTNGLFIKEKSEEPCVEMPEDKEKEKFLTRE